MDTEIYVQTERHQDIHTQIHRLNIQKETYVQHMCKHKHKLRHAETHTSILYVHTKIIQ